MKRSSVTHETQTLKYWCWWWWADRKYFTLFCHSFRCAFGFATQVTDNIVEHSFMFEEERSHQACVYDLRAIPWNWNHTPQQEHTLELREIKMQNISDCNFLLSLVSVKNMFNTHMPLSQAMTLQIYWLLTIVFVNKTFGNWKTYSTLRSLDSTVTTSEHPTTLSNFIKNVIPGK